MAAFSWEQGQDWNEHDGLSSSRACLHVASSHSVVQPGHKELDSRREKVEAVSLLKAWAQKSQNVTSANSD